MKPVIEVMGIERHCRLKLRNTLTGILLKPIGYSEMVMGQCQLRVHLDRALEVRDGLLATIQHRQ